MNWKTIGIYAAVAVVALVILYLILGVLPAIMSPMVRVLSYIAVYAVGSILGFKKLGDLVIKGLQAVGIMSKPADPAA